MMRGSAGGGTCARLASLIWRLKTPGVAQRLGRTRGLASGVQAPINENKKSHIRQKPQKQICIPVLEYFDKKYRHEHGELWDKVREVLLLPCSWQYGVLVNKFSHCVALEQLLQSQGYWNFLQDVLPFSKHSLRCYVSRAQNRFPRLLHHAERLKEYYLLNAASLLPVLALDVQDGERVLDMCAAPGGKSVAILQSATPRHFLCNDHDSLRHKWLKQTLESFVPEDLRGVTSVTNLDGRDIGPQQPQIFDKVLVDAPCSNDRSWLFSSDVLKARLRIAHTPNLPVLQKQLLRSALEALCPGGTMVYSTCTLSRAENDDVVASLLNSCDNIQTVDLTDLACSLSHSFTFAEGVQYGQLIVPEKGRTWGPMYVSKLWKTH
ncbi:tRNA (cytosine(34)-C(5))-methyltransferase, mitochondrial-like isoform X1 [Pristis pectinata]|uniref:tRNA (cytosine(34)-C(5))-methyltransferase, mitochondrial-like isoform X1 n=1 Tax=Pristis pectinata TaxID=685728 RepID=UPI00223D3D71|nr:tRNA (cytosine(34)-C(5))-methyltransferase, mitochondrial-like isoform X1 [Pristis pectinata]